jgi:O-antigen biosynthesis protein
MDLQKQEKMILNNPSHTDISIVIVNYNVKDYLYSCIESIKQASKNLKVQIIVVDNNSEDGSVEFISRAFPNVEIIPLSENIGFGKANNLGFEKAAGKYILILNPDTLLQSDTLDEMYKYMENHSEVGISVCKVLNTDGSFQASCRRGFPGPWSAFSKLFGMQSLFPKSKLFGKYNLTYMPTDNTYYVDAVTGAFMFARADVIKQVNGFDPEFFMYGEDLDLCYRVVKAGYKNAYVPTTSIIHHKGESSKRSSLNEINLFYEAMEIFVSKHYSNSRFFLALLKLGILTRASISYLYKYKLDVKLMAMDAIFIIIGILLGTYMALGSPFGLQPYAYPTVFIAVIFITIMANITAGGFFESTFSPTKTIFGYAISFLVLSTLIYFFPGYRFSRGALLVTIGFGMTGSTLLRIVISAAASIKNNYSDKQIVIVSTPEDALNLHKLISENLPQLKILGFIHSKPAQDDAFPLKWLGTINHLNSIIENEKISDVIVTDEQTYNNEISFVTSKYKNPRVNFHVANQLEDFIVSKLISEITENKNEVLKYRANLIRYRIIKRTTDIVISFFLLTVGLVFLLMINNKQNKIITKIFNVLNGKYSFIGIFELPGRKNFGKPGLTGLAHLNQANALSEKAILKLNEYYLKHYSVSLDFDILLKLFYREKWQR